MKTLVFLLEEVSAKAMLEQLLPKILSGDIQTRLISFDGKGGLKKRLHNFIQGWQLPKSHFIILCDKDDAECKVVKEDILSRCPKNKKNKILVRIACHELESWYLGDLKAVEQCFGIKKLSEKQNKEKYRNPDNIVEPDKELKRLH